MLEDYPHYYRSYMGDTFRFMTSSANAERLIESSCSGYDWYDAGFAFPESMILTTEAENFTRVINPIKEQIRRTEPKQ